MSKRQKSVTRCYGGVLSAYAVRNRYVTALSLERQAAEEDSGLDSLEHMGQPAEYNTPPNRCNLLSYPEILHFEALC